MAAFRRRHFVSFAAESSPLNLSASSLLFLTFGTDTQKKRLYTFHFFFVLFATPPSPLERFVVREPVAVFVLFRSVAAGYAPMKEGTDDNLQVDLKKRKKKVHSSLMGLISIHNNFKGVDSELPVVKFPTHRLIFRVLFLTL